MFSVCVPVTPHSSNSSVSGDDDDDDDDDNGDDSNKDYIKEALAGGKKDEDEFGDDDDDEKSAEAGVDDAGALQLAIDATKNFIFESAEFSDQELIEYVANQQMASALKSHDKVRILVEAAFTKDFFAKKEVELFAPALSAITNGNRIMERHLIASLEVHCQDRTKNFPVILKQLYDEDALQEETILEWADEGRTEFTLDCLDEEVRAVLRSEAEPVVVWLQEAESENSSDDDDDE